MPRLLLLRHAKAATPPELADRERPLSARGREDAAAVGRAMAAAGLVPDLALVSPARRTWQTLAGLAAALPAFRIEPQPGLYGAEPDSILAHVWAVAPPVSTLLVVGHNPGMGRLAASLGCNGPMQDGAYPTGTLAWFEGDGSWAEAGPATLRFRQVLTPADAA